MYNRMSRGYILPPISDWGVWRGMPLEVVYNNHSPAPIYGGYLPRTGVYCGARSVPGAIYVLAICIVGCLAHTWCKRGVALVKFQTFPISYGVTYMYFGGHICILRGIIEIKFYL